MKLFHVEYKDTWLPDKLSERLVYAESSEEAIKRAGVENVCYARAIDLGYIQCPFELP